MDISVYMIRNKRTGKFYVGYSQETEKRFKSHVNMLKRNEHHCIHLQRAWSIDGEDAFEFIRIKTFDAVEKAILEEQNQFDQHFLGGMMYNSVGTNDKSVAIKKAHSRAAIQKSTESKKNSKRFLDALAKNRLKATTPEAQIKRLETARRNGLLGQATCKSVVARKEIGGETIIYKSIHQAAKVLGLSQGNIHSCCNGTRPRVGGYLFSYELPELGVEITGDPKRYEQVQMLNKKLRAFE